MRNCLFEGTCCLLRRSKNEGNSGTTAFTFTVSLSAAFAQAVTVNYATANGHYQECLPQKVTKNMCSLKLAKC